MAKKRDPGLDALLPLDGEVFFVDADGKYYVKFGQERPGLAGASAWSQYSLTLHDGNCWTISGAQWTRC